MACASARVLITVGSAGATKLARLVVAASWMVTAVTGPACLAGARVIGALRYTAAMAPAVRLVVATCLVQASALVVIDEPNRAGAEGGATQLAAWAVVCLAVALCCTIALTV